MGGDYTLTYTALDAARSVNARSGIVAYTVNYATSVMSSISTMNRLIPPQGDKLTFSLIELYTKELSSRISNKSRLINEVGLRVKPHRPCQLGLKKSV